MPLKPPKYQELSPNPFFNTVSQRALLTPLDPLELPPLWREDTAPRGRQAHPADSHWGPGVWPRWPPPTDFQEFLVFIDFLDFLDFLDALERVTVWFWMFFVNPGQTPWFAVLTFLTYNWEPQSPGVVLSRNVILTNRDVCQFACAT